MVFTRRRIARRRSSPAVVCKPTVRPKVDVTAWGTDLGNRVSQCLGGVEQPLGGAAPHAPLLDVVADLLQQLVGGLARLAGVRLLDRLFDLAGQPGQVVGVLVLEAP